jgi:hypothetical protein
MDTTAINLRISRRRRTIGAALGATLVGVVGCGTGAATNSAPPPTSSPGISPTATAATHATTSPATGVPAAATASDAAVYWVTQILGSHYQRACLASAPGAAGPGQDPSRFCPSTVFTKMAQSLHKAWAKPGVTLPPNGTVQVTAVTMPSADGTVTVPDTTITLDGRTLRSLELIGASGDTGSVSLSLIVKKVGDDWHVSNWNVDL